MSTLRSQRLARKAHDRVEARAKATSDGYIPAKYASRVKNLPVWVRENGLVQTLVFLKAKASGDSGEADKELLEDIAAIIPECVTAEKLIERAQNDPSIAYRLLTRDALSACMWMKRWCETYEKPKSKSKPDTKAPEQDENQ